jgi:lipopolysaccharide transport system permease protein
MSVPDVIVYRAAAEPFSLLSHLRRLVRHREILVTFTLRDLKVRYAQTLLGVLWAVIPPVMLMVVFNLLFSRFARMPSEGVPYPVFVYSALLPWTFFSSSLVASANSVTGNYGIISKVYFPREVLPWAAIAATGVDFLVAAVIFVGMAAYYHTPVTWYLLLAVPLLAVQLVFASGVGLLVAAFNVYYRDVRHALPLLLQLWMYATPIVYPSSVLPEGARIAAFVLNPMAALIDGYRRVLVHGAAPQLAVTVWAVALSLLVFLTCYRLFKRLEREFADVM